MHTSVAWIALGGVACTTAVSPRGAEVEVAANGSLPAAPRPPLPATADVSCEARCLGYSPSTGMWLCGGKDAGSGMVSWPGTRCGLQILRDVLVLADISVVDEVHMQVSRGRRR
jgi:hypothetical protein